MVHDRIEEAVGVEPVVPAAIDRYRPGAVGHGKGVVPGVVGFRSGTVGGAADGRISKDFDLRHGIALIVPQGTGDLARGADGGKVLPHRLSGLNDRTLAAADDVT